jgi:hypothetical protein
MSWVKIVRIRETAPFEKTEVLWELPRDRRLLTTDLNRLVQQLINEGDPETSCNHPVTASIMVRVEGQCQMFVSSKPSDAVRSRRRRSMRRS